MRDERFSFLEKLGFWRVEYGIPKYWIGILEFLSRSLFLFSPHSTIRICITRRVPNRIHVMYVFLHSHLSSCFPYPTPCMHDFISFQKEKKGKLSSSFSFPTVPSFLVPKTSESWRGSRRQGRNKKILDSGLVGGGGGATGRDREEERNVVHFLFFNFLVTLQKGGSRSCPWEKNRKKVKCKGERKGIRNLIYGNLKAGKVGRKVSVVTSYITHWNSFLDSCWYYIHNRFDRGWGPFSRLSPVTLFKLLQNVRQSEKTL